MNPIIPRWKIRRMEDLTVEALVRLHQKLEG